MHRRRTWWFWTKKRSTGIANGDFLMFLLHVGPQNARQVSQMLILDLNPLHRRRKPWLSHLFITFWTKKRFSRFWHAKKHRLRRLSSGFCSKITIFDTCRADFGQTNQQKRAKITICDTCAALFGHKNVKQKKLEAPFATAVERILGRKEQPAKSTVCDACRTDFGRTGVLESTRWSTTCVIPSVSSNSSGEHNI